MMEIEDKECLVKEIWSGKKWYTSIRKNNQRAVFILWEDDFITTSVDGNWIGYLSSGDRLRM